LRINSTHEAPVHVGSPGYRRVALTGHHSGPQLLDVPGPKETAGARRRRAKEAVRARRAEVKAGAGFLERLTRTSQRGR
jgi:hypothetical protein